METTTIELSRENWQWLNSLKLSPGESFNDVLDRLRTDMDSPPDTGYNLPDSLDLPGSGEKLTYRRGTISRMYVHLTRHRTATKSDLLELVDTEKTGYASPESFWSNCVKGKDTLQSLPGVHPPGPGERTWRFVPE